MSASVKGAFAIFCAYFLYAISDAGAKWLVADLSVWQVLFIRSLVAAVVCVVVLGWARCQQLLAWPWRREIVIMNAANFIGWVAYYSAARDMPLTQLYCMYYLSPIITILLGGILLKERVTAWHWCATAVGFSGALIVINPSSDLPRLLPFCLGLATAFFWAIAGVLYRRTVSYNDNWVLISSFNAVMALLCSLPMSQTWLPPTLSHWGVLAIVSLSALAAHYFYLNGMRLVTVAVAGPISFSSLLWSVILGNLIFSDWPPLRVIIGALLIVLAGVIVITTLPTRQQESLVDSTVVPHPN